MKKIYLLCTGGTIAASRGCDGLTPTLTGEEILKFIPGMQGYCHIDVAELFNIDSTNMTPEHWCAIAKQIQAHYDAYDGFVILHGTDTMAYTAAALSYMVQNSQKPIVLTGSQKPICLDVTDAKTNLTDSLRYACDEESSGVQVVFDGRVIAGTRAKKTHAHSYDAFSSVNFPLLAVIQEGKIIRYLPPITYTAPVAFFLHVHRSIAVLKLIPGSQPALLEYMFRQYDCLLIEGFGVGGLPAHLEDAFCKLMAQFTRDGKLAVITTQVLNEGSNMEVYEVGQRVKRAFDLLETYDMTFEAAVTKLMYLMARHPGQYDAIRKGFYQTIHYDILDPQRG